MANSSQTLPEIVDVSQPCTAPERIVLDGTYIKLVPMQRSHNEEMWPLLEGPENESLWTWWPAGPYADYQAWDADISDFYDRMDPLFWAIVEAKSGKCLGHAILGELDINQRVIEAGMFATLPLQRTTASTEAFYLIGRYAFSLGFRRLAWRTNSFNKQSRRAAERYGFTLEGIHRQIKIDKGRSRDTACFSIIDKEWPVCQLAFEKWLHPDNFDSEGRQKMDLISIRKQLEKDGGL